MVRLHRVVLSSLTMFMFASCHSDSTGPGGGGSLPSGLTLKLTPFVSSGLTNPVFMTQPLDDGRIFVVEQGGRIRLVKNGTLQTTPFLDITSKVLSGGERGLLSVAFHPRYAVNHFFYVYFTTQTNGDIRIERYTTTANADVADAASAKLIITIPHSSQPNHNGGLLAFGPGTDQALYAGIGDGGGSGDPLGSGQNFNTLLGSLIRIDVDGGDPYAIPANNPFVGQANRRGEIWAKGLRNPWRYAFDGATGLLYIADVGQGALEEVNVAPVNSAGLNYGWNITEGSSCYNAATCNRTGLTNPVIDYPHVAGACSITGGYVYRGTAISGLQGHYLYGDYCSGFIRSFRYSNGAAADQKDWGLSAPSLSSFGQDFHGELYVLSGNTIYQIAQGP